MHYGGATPKRHRGWTNHKKFSDLDLGKLPMSQRTSVDPENQPVKRYKNQDGRSSYSGTSSLKQTQTLNCV